MPKSFCAQTGMDRLKHYINRLTNYYRHWKIDINEHKTETISITRKFGNTNIINPIKINNKPILNKTGVKYLGVWQNTLLPTSYNPNIT